MKRLAMPSAEIPAHLWDDVLRIIGACFDAGYIMSYSVAFEAWQAYSKKSDAEWLGMPDDNSVLVQDILSVTELIGEEK